MKTFFVSIFKYGLVLFGLFTVICYLIYSYYHSLPFDQKNDEIKILILGDSHPQHSIDKSLLNKSSNKSSSGEPYFYSLLKLNIYNELYPNVETLILGVSYHSLNQNVEDRIDAYSFYMSLYPYLKGRSQIVDIDEYISLKTELEVYLAYEFGIPSKSCVAELKNEFIGYESFGLPILSNTLNHHYYALSGEINKPSSVQFDLLEKLVEFCEINHIKLVLYNSPVKKEYLSLVPSSYIHLTDSIASSYANNENVFYLNYSNYDLPDSCFADYDHLNETGARVFTPIIEERLKSLGLIE